LKQRPKPKISLHENKLGTRIVSQPKKHNNIHAKQKLGTTSHHSEQLQ